MRQAFQEGLQHFFVGSIRELIQQISQGPYPEIVLALEAWKEIVIPCQIIGAVVGEKQ